MRPSLLLQDLLLSVGLYVCTNVALWAGGVRSAALAAGYLQDFASRLGIGRGRALLPLATGINTFGSEAVVAIAGAVGVFRLAARNWFRYRALGWMAAAVLAWVIGVMSVAGILLVDSRLALLIATLTIAAACWPSRAVLRVLLIALPGIALFPLLWYGGLLAFGGMIADSLLDRGFSGAQVLDFATLNYRTVFWFQAATLLAAQAANVVFGFGAYGHVASGIVDTYGELLAASYGDISRVPTHNAFVQHFVDTGLFGTAVFFILVAWVLQRALRLARDSHQGQEGAALAALVMVPLLLLSLTETAPYFIIERIPASLLLAVAAILSCGYASGSPARGAAATSRP